jgi:hypothetical protein
MNRTLQTNIRNTQCPVSTGLYSIQTVGEIKKKKYGWFLDFQKYTLWLS